MNTFNHIAQALQEAEIDLYEVAKEDPASVRVEKINPSSLEGQRIGNGQFGFVKGQWILYMANIYADIMLQVKTFYILFHTILTDETIYGQLEELPYQIKDLEARSRFLIAMIEDLKASKLTPAHQPYKDTLIHFYEEALNELEEIFTIIDEVVDLSREAAE